MSDTRLIAHIEKLEKLLHHSIEVQVHTVEGMTCQLSRLDSALFVQQLMLQYLFAGIFKGKEEQFEVMMQDLGAQLFPARSDAKTEDEQERLLNARMFFKLFVDSIRKTMSLCPERPPGLPFPAADAATPPA